MAERLDESARSDGNNAMKATDGTIVKRRETVSKNTGEHKRVIIVNGVTLCPFKLLMPDELLFIENYLASAIPDLRKALGCILDEREKKIYRKKKGTSNEKKINPRDNSFNALRRRGPGPFGDSG